RATKKRPRGKARSRFEVIHVHYQNVAAAAQLLAWCWDGAGVAAAGCHGAGSVSHGPDAGEADSPSRVRLLAQWRVDELQRHELLEADWRGSKVSTLPDPDAVRSVP